jgi:phosphatidylglycerol lysyltransferase
MNKRFLRSLPPVIGLLLFGAALWILHHELKSFHYDDVMNSLREIPGRQLTLGFILTAANYGVLTGYDFLAFRYIRHPLPYLRIALASFIGYALSHNLGNALITGGSVRYRLYSSWGLSATEITRVVVFCIGTFWLGFFALGGVLLLTEPPEILHRLHTPFTTLRPAGALALMLVVAYLLLCVFKIPPLKIRGLEFTLPSSKISVIQVGLSCLDWTLAGSVFYILLPPSDALSYPAVLGIFMFSQMGGLISQIPGGLGVLESVAMLLLSPFFPASAILGSLLVYRAIYYLLPLLISVLLLGVYELLQRREPFIRITRIFSQWAPEVIPQILAFTTFIGGALLLFSGATPPVSSRFEWLRDLMPLPVLELSHFFGSLVGMGLLILARGLQQRLDASYFLTLILLAAGTVFSILKGLDFEEALVLAVFLVAFLPCRREFYRKASLIGERFTVGWIVAILLVILSSIWLGVFSYKHIEYSSELWWRFSFTGHASRFLRATVGALSLTLLFALAKLLRPVPVRPAFPGPNELDMALGVIRNSPRTAANLALLGDKSLLFNDRRTAFIMFGVEARSWVALGDPIGPETEMPELVWQFRELCDRYGGWTVFYQVDQTHLPLYLDVGLALQKLGEEGRVSLESFSLEGGSRKELRHEKNQLEKEGWVFEILPAESVPVLIPELKRISDGWLSRKNAREKGFSLGFFDARYLERFPVAVIRSKDRPDRIVAFANVWLGADREELSVDLMRYTPEAPHNVMDFLFIRLMLWGKAEGYRWFNLGMAPLSGFEDRALAPLWSRIGSFVFRHGEHFYNFQGIRRYKDKFEPEWKPKYLASPGGLSLPVILKDVAALIGGGLKGIVTR